MNGIRLVAIALFGSVAALWAVPPAEKHFLTKVQPLLEARCVSCHGAEKQKGGLRLDSRAAVLKGGETGPAVVPGKPKESLLLQAVRHTTKELGMPPKEKLTPADVALLDRWIADGAPWPQKPQTFVAATPRSGERLGDAWSDPRNPIVTIFRGERLDLWSLRPVSPPPAPDRGDLRTRNGIDRFVLYSLREATLTFAPEADRRTLIRRLYFDLTGLPPTPADVAAFLEDQAPDAYERLVDRLLASERYGEHWARQWLDVVRYSDSNGFDWDEFRPHAWRFRDYVIRSLNADKPFDQFIREQLAGDELVEGAPRNVAEQDALIATGYLRLGPHDNSAPAFNEQDRSRAELLADLTETTAGAFLGLTMSCCRCHDHKYDPLSQADHFRLRAFFEPVKFADDRPLDLALEQAAAKAHNDAVEQKIQPVREARDTILQPVLACLREERIARLTEEERGWLALPKEERSGDRKARAEAVEKKVQPSEKEALAFAPEAARARAEELAKQIDLLKKERRAAQTGLLMTDADDPTTPTRIHFQGDYKQPREAVEPGFISALDPNPATIQKGRNAKTTGRRLTLAEWIASPKNPLTARVVVNRVWQGHFGRGLVTTPNDFGLAGARPSHPELLDWLAAEFIRDGWSLKKLHRLIVTSATWRQRSDAGLAPDAGVAPDAGLAPEAGLADRNVSRADINLTLIGAPPTVGPSPDAARIDSDNRLLWRQNPRRLSAEQLRDALLAVSGRLIESKGGPPIWPELPAEIAQANPAFLDDNAEKTKGWYPSPAAQRPVRSIFLVQKRTVRVPFLETFDLPENSTSCAGRSESTVAPQALALLNSPLSIEVAEAFAARIEQEAGNDPAAQVRTAFVLALQRPPDRDELERSVAFLKSRSLPELGRAVLNLNEFVYLD